MTFVQCQTMSHRHPSKGRPKSPRTGQVHARVLPPIYEEIAEEAAKRDVTQGVALKQVSVLY